MVGSVPNLSNKNRLFEAVEPHHYNNDCHTERVTIYDKAEKSCFSIQVLNLSNYLDSHSNMSYYAPIEFNMSENKLTSDLLRGHTDTMILRLLSEADRYGYEIVKLIAELSGGEYELKEATMYSSVRRLEADGDIEWYWGDETQGGRRKYFRITAKGKSTYANNKSNWEYAKRILDNLL
jgi:DNA-binding PadR family transcriptional regulator